MTTFRLSDLARVTGGRLVGADREFAAVTTDSRAHSPDALFVALKGPSFDGHEFVSAALLQGAVAALVEREVPVAISQVVVPTALAALSAFACDWRRRHAIPVVGITGSNGKTTTKELIGSILGQLGPCLVTRGNLNNHIGVPLTLMRLDASHRTAVIEMGANHQGEIRHLAGLAEPTIGIVTNAGAAHLEGFGSLEGVAHGKGEMFESLPANGVAIVNADDAYAEYWREIAASERLWTFGLNAPADFAAHDIRMSSDPSGFRSEFKLTTPAGERPALLRLAGLHNVRNAIGAAAAAFAAGASLDQLVSGLANAAPVGGRLELKAAINGAFLIDDSYNANPSSLKAGLDALSSLPGKHWLVLGDMLELGPTSPDLHAEVGRYARTTGVERLLAVGSYAHFAVEAFGSNAHWFADLDALIAEARQLLSTGVTVLIKGSRGNRLERVSAALALDPKASEPHH